MSCDTVFRVPDLGREDLRPMPTTRTDRLTVGVIAVVIAVAFLVVVPALRPTVRAVLAGNRPTLAGTSWMLALEVGTSHCGAVLIGPQMALTAAHCVTDEPREEVDGEAARRATFCGNRLTTPPSGVASFAVRAGSKIRLKGESITVDRVSVHPSWSWRRSSVPGSAAGDLAVLALERPIAGATPLPLATVAARPDEVLTAYGWGAQDPYGCDGPSRTLRQYLMAMREPIACARFAPVIGDVCAQSLRRAGGVRAGDSGGPLLRWTNGQPELVGLVTDYSLGGELSLHADMGLYRHWIADEVRQLTS